MVYQADENAAINVKNRLTDTEISLYTPFKQVRKIILERTDSQRTRLPVQDSSCISTINGERTIQNGIEGVSNNVQ